MTDDLLIITKSSFKLEDKLKVQWDECNGIDSKALNRPLNPLWRMNTNSSELPVIVLHPWDRGQGMFKKHYLKLVCIPICMYVFGVRLSVA